MIKSSRVFHYYASKWLKRLSYLNLYKRMPERPTPPDYQEFSPEECGLTPVKPAMHSKRTGLLGYKLGMMSIWDEWGQRHPVTVVKCDRNVVLNRKTLENEGYEAVQLGLGFRNMHRHSRPQLGVYIKANSEPKHRIAEFRVTPECLLPLGTRLSVRHFVPGQWVFMSGWSRARGWQGVIKRWGFKGLPRTHGTTGSDIRSGGSIGQRGAAVVHPGKKMAGHMGPDPRCMNGYIMRIDVDRELLYIRGTLPGKKTSMVKISDARGVTRLKNKHIHLPYPTFCPQPGIKYPNVVQAAPQDRDPFLYAELPFHRKDDFQ